MAARVHKIRHDEETRAKIQTSQIINRLHAFIMGEIKLEPAQVSAGLGLLRKTIPDLSQAENKTEVTHRYVARVPDKSITPDKWHEQHAPQPTLQ